MRQDKEGFLIPIVDESKCKDCGLCEKKCPIINTPLIDGITPKVYATYNLNKEQHQKSASGGLFSAFANYFYAIDNGVICASAFDSSLHLQFYLSTNKEDLKKLRGSKYVQSEIGFIYKEIKKLLVEHKEVFFIGTPCQIAGLRAYLSKDYDNLFTIDLVCHGVPSPLLFKTYLNSLGVSTVTEYDNYFFRNQKDSIYFTNSYKIKGGKTIFIPPNQHSYICAYLKSWIHREACYNCHFTGEHRQGDITIGDFWGILAGKVNFDGIKNEGVSMVMLNTTKGIQIFEKIKHQLYFEEKTLEDALIDNHNLIHPDKRPKERDYIYKELMTLTPEKFIDKYNCKMYLPVSIWKRVLYKILRTLG